MFRNSRLTTRYRAGSKNRAYSVKSEYDSDSDTGSDHYPLKTIFVNNIDPEVSEEKLKKFFGNFGRVIKLNIKTHKEKKSYAYVKYDHPDYFLQALKEAQYRKVGRYEIIVMTPADRKKLRREGKIFVKGLNEGATTRELHELFEKVSKNMYVSFSTNKDGKHLDMGCIHFFDPRDAERALRDLQGKEFQGYKLELSKWLPRDQREEKPKQNLFVSNLGKMNKYELESYYRPIFEIFGEIESLVFNETKLTAMLMYKVPEDAQDALDNLAGMEDCSGLEVYWLKTQSERAKEAHEIKNRLYLDGLIFEITAEILKKEFGQYGQITSLDMKSSRTIQKDIKSKYAVIAYSNEDEAEKAIAKARKNEDIKKLFVSHHHIKIEYFEIQQKGDFREKKSWKKDNNNFAKPPFTRKNQFLNRQNFPPRNFVPQPVHFMHSLPMLIPMSNKNLFQPPLTQPMQKPLMNQNDRLSQQFPEEFKVQNAKYQPIIEEQENLDKSSFYSNSVDVSGIDNSKMSGMDLGHNDTLSFENEKQDVLLKESLRLTNFANKTKNKKVVWSKNVPNSFK